MVGAQNYRAIPLTRGAVALVDAADYGLVAQRNWYLGSNCAKDYAYSANAFGEKPRTILMHRLIMGVVEGPSDVMVDHINHDGLDNRRENLRLCSNRGNQGNQKLRGGTSRFRGVFLNGYGTWTAGITMARKKRTLGAYKSEEHAARAYDVAAAEHFGSFASLNYPDTIEQSRALIRRLGTGSTRPHTPKWKRAALKRAREECGFSYAQLAVSFGVSESTAYRICRTTKRR